MRELVPVVRERELGIQVDGPMRRRHASINDMPVQESERKFHWPAGRRPDGHPRTI